MDPSVFYKKEMIVVVDGVAREGVITMPIKDQHTVRVIAKSDVDLLVVESCQGIDAVKNAWNVTETIPSGPFGWFSKTIVKKRENSFVYRPEGIGKTSDCELHVRGYSKNGVHSEGLVGFQTKEYELQGMMICNKNSRLFEGYEICQSGKGLIQEVHFEEDVRVESSPGCDIGSKGKSFAFSMPEGDCLFTFKGKNSFGKLRTYGFTSIAMEVN